jgi:hypothetical protein
MKLLNLKHKQTRQFLSFIFLLVAIPLTLLAVYLPLMLWPKAQTADPHLYLAPETSSMPPNITYQLMMDAKTHQIGFVRAVLTFDRTRINLASEITTTASLNQVDSNNNPWIIRTSRTDANNSGKIILVLGLKPNSTAPTGNFELAKLPFTAVTTTSNLSTAINFDSADIQLVNLSVNQLAFTSKSASITLNPSGPTNTPAPNPTATPTPSGPSPTPGATTTVTYQITTGADDVNEDGTGFNATNTEGWIGSGSNTASSFTGLRFTNINVPQNATVKEAYFEVLSSTDQWNPVVYTLYADNSGNSSTFSSTSKPSQRTGTTATVNYNKDENWLNNTWRRSDNIAGVIQEIVNRSDWKSGNSVSLIAKGGGNQWGRKFFRNYEYGSTSAAKLIITYQTSSPPPEPADLDGDGDIDYIDLLRFLPNLGTTNNIFNFVGNAIVDLFDFNYLIKRL